MNSLYLDPHRLQICLRAVKTVALSDGTFDDHERRLLDAAARALTPPGDTPPDCGALDAMSPQETAAALTDPETRTRLIQAMLITALIDGEVSAPEYETIKTFADALGVDEPRLCNLKQILGEHTMLLKFDLMRKSTMVDDVVAHAWKTGGIKGVWKEMIPMLGGKMGVDHALAVKYQKLGLLPESTFGRQYWIHMRSEGFGFPGEPASFSEAFIKHDCCHVLGGYATDPASECEVVSFIAGFMQGDPFWYIFMIAVHMHLGIETFHKNPLGEMAFEPERVVRALQRGRAVNRDLYATDFDWFPYFSMDIDAVRAEFGIGPK